MSLATDALAGLDVGYVGGAVRPLAGGLAELGARIAADEAAVDLLLIQVGADHGLAADRASPTAGILTAAGGHASLDAAANGGVADALNSAFSASRDAASRLRTHGCLLFVLSSTDPAARAAVASLARTLALEWSPDLRVNALVCADPTDAVDLAALVAWRASRTLTGAILDVTAGEEYGSDGWRDTANPKSTGPDVSSPKSCER